MQLIQNSSERFPDGVVEYTFDVVDEESTPTGQTVTLKGKLGPHAFGFEPYELTVSEA